MVNVANSSHGQERDFCYQYFSSTLYRNLSYIFLFLCNPSSFSETFSSCIPGVNLLPLLATVVPHKLHYTNFLFSLAVPSVPGTLMISVVMKIIYVSQYRILSICILACHSNLMTKFYILCPLQNLQHYFLCTL